MLNADGNLFRWGEPRYGAYASSTEQSVPTYYDSVSTIPPSPSGAPWVFATGQYQLELFIDAAGHAYFDSFLPNRPVQLIEITQPDHDRRWKSASVFSNSAVLINDQGQPYSAYNLYNVNSSSFSAVPLTVPVTGDPVVQASVSSYGDIVRTAAGEIYTESWSSSWAVGGSVDVPGGPWLKVPRPAGVSQWVQLSANDSAAVAKGDDGNFYYWGQAIPGSVFLNPDNQYRVSNPVVIAPPAGSGGWLSAEVAGSLVFLVGNNGSLYTLGSGPAFLAAPSNSLDPYFDISSPTLSEDPGIVGLGALANVQCGSDYVVVQGADGTVYHWGQFMLLYGVNASSTALPPRAMAFPDDVVLPGSRLSPGARLLNPAAFSLVRMGDPLTLSAEVFPLEGTLASVQFLVNGVPVAGTPTVSNLLAQQSWTPKSPGPQSIAVQATDSNGLVTTSPAISVTVMRSVHWTISTNNISEPPASEVPTSATVIVTRSEMPYPNYERFTFRFQVGPQPLLGLKFNVTGATPAPDNSGDWEITFEKGQTEQSFQIQALENQFTDPNVPLWIVASYRFASDQGYIPPDNSLSLNIEDATPTFGSAPVSISGGTSTIYGFVGDQTPLTVSVLKSLTMHPVLYLQGSQPISSQQLYVEELPDRWLFHCLVSSSEEGLIAITARVEDQILMGFFYGYRDSNPINYRVWSRDGLPTVRVIAGAQTVNESNAQTIYVTVERNGNDTNALNVALNIRGLAVNGTDYGLVPSSVTIPAGASYTRFPVNVLNDTLPELNEDAVFSAQQTPCDQLDGCFVADTSSEFRVTILDDDTPASLLPSAARVVASPFSDVSYLITASGQLYGWGDNTNARIGLGPLPAEMAGQVPWPRRLFSLVNGGKWESLFLGVNQVFATTDQGEMYGWGTGLDGSSSFLNITEPELFSFGDSAADPQFVNNGRLIGRLASGHLQANTLTPYAPRLVQAVGSAGLPEVLVTPQNMVLSDDGYFHEPSDWFGGSPELYPLAAGAGYWRDTAYCGDVVIAVDELGRMFELTGGAYVYYPATGNTVRSFSSSPLAALPGGRTVAGLYGNDLGVLALATDGTLYSLYSKAIGVTADGGDMVAFPTGVTKWVSFAAGRGHYLAVGDDGNVYSWGENNHGQLGDGTDNSTDVPHLVPAFSGVNDPAREFPLVEGNFAPLIGIDLPNGPLNLDGPTNVDVVAHAFDPDGSLQQVEILVDGASVGEAIFDPARFAFVASVFIAHPGDHVLTARALDDSGLSTESAGIAIHVDDPGLHPIVKVWNDPTGTAEGYDVPANFVISRQGIADVPLTVYFNVSGTATEGVDYPVLPRSVVIPAGAAEVRIPVYALPDFIVEGTEEVDLTIVNPGCDPETAAPGSGCYRIGTPATAPVYLIDYLVPGDARLPLVSLAAVEPIAREGTTNVARVEVRRNGSTLNDLTVHYSLGGDAQNGVDYAPLSGVAVIPAGQVMTSITIAAIEDYIPENYERVIVSLDNPGCGPGQGSADGCFRSSTNNVAVVYIEDNIVPPVPPGLGVDTVPRPVLFEKLQWLDGQGALVGVASDPGSGFTVQASTDLVHWTSLGNFTNASGHMQFLDVNAMSGHRFYRAVPTGSP